MCYLQLNYVLLSWSQKTGKLKICFGNQNSFTVITFKLILLSKKVPTMGGISILAYCRPMGHKIPCCGSIWSRQEPFLKPILGCCVV